MLIDELKEKIKSTEPDIKIIQAYWQNSNIDTELDKLEKISKTENFWQDPNQAEVLKELHKAKQLSEQYNQVIKSYQDLPELLELFEDDESELIKIQDDIYKWVRSVTRFKLNVLLTDENASSNCYLSINSGAGGTESQDWAEILLRMYIRFCEREGLESHILDYQSAEAAGIKSATVYVKGKNAYGLLQGEEGIHRLVRISPYDSNKRRHTSFAAAAVIPEIKKAEIVIDPNDLRIDTYRASGAGGQHVNKTDSAVRITHIPTNTVSQCQNGRSQTQNKETAMKMLMAKLVQKQKEEEKAKSLSIERKKIEWGSQIRSYILHPYKLVKDHRTDLEHQQPDLVLDGDIIDFIEANLIREQSNN